MIGGPLDGSAAGEPAVVDVEQVDQVAVVDKAAMAEELEATLGSPEATEEEVAMVVQLGEAEPAVVRVPSVGREVAVAAPAVQEVAPAATVANTRDIQSTAGIARI